MKPYSGFVFPMLTLTTLLALSGCGGGGSSANKGNDAARTVTDTNSPTTTTAFDSAEFFQARIQPRLAFCATCHVAGGLADTDAGDGLLLSTNSASHYDDFYASWRELGEGTANNPLLTKNALMDEAHSGGKSWPVGSEAYNDVMTLFGCWNNPDSCDGDDDYNDNEEEPPVVDDNDLPLLEMGPTKAPMVAGCEGKPDDAPLPLDPRSLVVEGINKPGLAVQFNAYWVDVHTPLPPYRNNPLQRAQTCGEWKERVALGEEQVKFGSRFFGGLSMYTPRSYRSLWKAWGLQERPDNFDEEILKRYGLVKADFRNPYPLEGEDPNLTDGGSGQLPLGLSMIKRLDGSYNGEIAVNCSFCHDSRLGTDDEGQSFHWGRGSNFTDIGMFGSDFDKLSGLPPLIPFPFSAHAGGSNALGVIDALFVLFDAETLQLRLGVELFPGHGSPGQMRAPHWWSRAWMTRLFKGALSSDNVRSTMALEVATFMLSGAERRAQEKDFENVNAFLNSLSPPAYPHPEQIDIRLAEAGAVLFHTKDLWAGGANVNIPKPDSNGSCAGCHGVYSPRYAADPTMLPDPRLKGVAGVTTPIEIIRTDPERTNVVSEPMKVAWNTSWWSYDELHPDWTPEGQGRPGQTRDRLRNDVNGGGQRLEGPNRWSDIKGYTAPPLYGVWAAAPYFHNGSVPTVWHVLKPSERPAIWVPPLTEATAPGLNKGFDYSLAAYDLNKLGWTYEEIPCTAGTERYNCNPTSVGDRILSWLSNQIGDKFWLGYQVPSPKSEKDLEARRIINTYEFSRGNEGHDFTDMLTDQERLALIEYMKTL